ncbi:MAG TPA: alpha/beta fold hydrolase [Bryobacteraceae bacterium]|jgi:aspartate racemase|nr:alpha/beta fold hydrolase [Bryobacteraceae bacterium]
MNTSEESLPTAPAEETYVLPASFGQERYWGLDHLNPGNPTWSVPVRFRLQGPLDPALLERAFNAIVERHEVLRTTFVNSSSGLSQVVHPSLRIPVPVNDLRHLPKPERDAEADRISLQEAHWRFDLEKGPLFRASLIRMEDSDYILLVNAHHSVTDYWSVGIISQELGRLYEAYSRGQEISLPELPIQYADYSVWQREQAESATVQNELSYWKKQLDNLPLLEFPLDHPRGESPTFNATITSILLPVALTNAIQDLATGQETTFFNAMFAALSILLHGYTGQTDFGVATQVAGRESVETESLVGPFINTVVLRPDLSGDPTFLELLGRVREVAFQSLDKNNVRFEQVLKALRPADYPSHHNLFRLNFICQRDPVKPQEFAGVKITVIPSKSQGALYDLHVFLIMRNEGWRLACEYNTDLFDAGTITRLLANYKALLENIVAGPDRPLSALPALDIPVPAPEASGPAPGAAKPAQAIESSAEETFAFPITIAQERFWLLEQLMPGNPTLNMPAAMRLKGTLDINILHKGLDEVVARHEGLRTTFSTVDGQPMQVIHPSVKTSVTRIDLQELPESEREARAEQHLRDEASHRFILSQAPLIRATVLQLEPDHHLMMVTTPHIICDGWSAGIIIRELAAFYEANAKGVSPALPPLTIQYADFAHWQANSLKGDAFQEELAYWKEQLQGRLPLLDLPADKPVPSRLVSRGDTETLSLAPDLVAKIKEICRREEVTMFMFFLAVFKAMLHRYTGQEDILVGSPVAGRSPETEGVIGLFSYPISLRTDVRGELSFRELLHRVRDVTLGALAHKDLPFGRLVEELRVEQVQGRNPLFQVYFLHQTGFLQPMETSGLSWTPVTWVSPMTSFDLHLATLERRGSVVARLEYNADIFEAATIRQMLGHFRVIVKSVVEDAGTSLSALPLSTAEEPQAISPARGNAPVEEHAKERLALEPVDGQLARDPSRVAAVSETGKLSYAKLDAEVSRLAERLRQRGVRPGVVVGICGPWSAGLMSAILAVRRCGAAHAWLDTESPSSDLAQRISAAGTRLVILLKKAEHIALPAGVSSLFPDRAGNDDSPASLDATVAADIACVLFTAGASGPPKAVLVSQAALSARAVTAASSAGLVAEDRVALAPSNASLEMLFGCLLRGATAIFVSRRVAASREEFPRFAGKQRCSVWVLAAPDWQRLIRNHDGKRPEFPDCVRLALVHGERLSSDSVSAFRRLPGKHLRCLSSYGAAESGANCAVYEIRAGAEGEAQANSLGIDAPGTAVRVMDRYLQPAAPGVTGEICIEGEMLAAGYSGDPAAAGAFTANPVNGHRLFRTGDFGRYLPNGSIEFLGPPDRHLNLRGYRLHLGDLEAALLRQPGVSAAAAMSWPDPTGDERPVAHIVVAQKGAGAAAAAREAGLRRQIRLLIEQQCPQYPQPSRILFTDRLPLDNQGRVIRRALPAPATVPEELSSAIAPPRDELEAQLVRIWEELLGVRPIGITDNFFDLHGHSLLAVRLFDRIKSIWGKHLPLSILFQAPTIEHLAAILRQEGWSANWSSLVTIQEGSSRPPLFIVSGLGGNVVRFRNLARYLGADQPVFALQPLGMDGSQPYLTRIEDMAAHYVREVKAKQPEGPYQLAGYSFGGLVVFEMARQLALAGNSVGLTALLDAPEWRYIAKTARSVNVMHRLEHLRSRIARILTGPDRWEYVSDALRQRLSRLVFKISARLGRPIPQRFGTLSDINAHAAALYVPQVYPGSLTLLRTRPDPRLPQGDYQLGWGGLAKGGVTVHEIMGDHLRITDEPNVQVLAQKLRECLDGVADGSRAGTKATPAGEPGEGGQPPAKEPRALERSILEGCV